MANRDVALGISGVVVGMLLGAGSVHFTQEASLRASSVDEVAAVYFDVDPSDTADVKARNVQDRVEEQVTKDNIRALRKARQERSQKEETHDSAPAQPTSACDIAKNLTHRMGLAITTVIPAQQEFEKFTGPLNVVLSNIEKDYCGAETSEDMDSAETMEKSARTQKVDNDCEQYEEGSRRQILCLGNQSENLPYTGE